MNRIVWLVAALALAGCADTTDVQEAKATPAGDTMVIRGSVLTVELTPITTANVTIEELNLTETVGADGSFRFPDLPLDVYTVTADAVDYIARSITVAPGANESLLLTLASIQESPVQHTDRYKGNLDCAAEYIIISGSCDRISTEFGGPELVDQESIFTHEVQANWRTLVVDVVFDGGEASTYDGLRVSVRGGDASDALNEYEQFARFHDSESYTFRLEPGGEYPHGHVPVPQNATTFVFDVFAQGHQYHAVCDPTGLDGSCFLGVGAGVDIQFELVVTTFYVEPAPEGFTLR